MGDRLRVMSANLWWGRADPDALVATLRHLEIDAIGCQELGFEQAEAIAEVLPHGLLAPSTGADGTGIALRSPAAFESVAMPYRDLRVARLAPADWPGLPGPLELASVHVAAPHIRPYGVGPLRRRAQMRALERYLRERPAERRVLVGDFNATPVWPVYRRMASHLTDAAVAVAQTEGRAPRPTWGPWAGSPRLLRIDHAFVGGLAPVAFRTVPIPGSDHDAIVIELSLSL